MLTWLLLLGIPTGLFVLISLRLASEQTYPARIRVSSTRLVEQLEDGLPVIPRSAQEALITMDDKVFEWFSAAVVMGVRPGYQFYRHCGGSGDQGVDTKLRNAWNVPVGVQSKFFISSNTVGSQDIRNFSGSLRFHKAPHGYFVTTSTFTRDAKLVIESEEGRIRGIDGPQLDVYLRWKRRDIALAYREVLLHKTLQERP